MIFTSTVTPPLEIGLRILGVWPDMPYAILRRCICMSSILTVYYFQYLYLSANYKDNSMQNLVDPFAMMVYYGLTILKLIILWSNCRVLHEMLAAIDTDWRECVKVDLHLNVMKTKASNSQLCTYALLGFNLFASAVYFGSDNVITMIHLMKGINDTSRPFPMLVLFPSVAQQSPLYELLVVLLFVQGMSLVYMIAIMNSLLSTLILHIGGQMDIIRHELKNIFVKASYNGSIEITTGMLVEKHNHIITFSENIDKLFSFVAMLQVFTNTSLICFLGLIALTSVNNENDVGLLKTVLAYIGITAEAFIFCFVGEYLSFKSKSIGDAGYESLWYNASPNHSKKILFVIMRSQKQLTITAGGMVNLSLETFASIMKASASYVSVLHAMY